MGNNWTATTLGEFVKLQRGHDLPDAERRAGNVPVIGSFGITGYHDTAIAKGPGVTVGRSGASFGVVSFCPIDFWPHNAALYVIDFHGNCPRFAYYFLKNIDFSSFNSGSAQPSLNRNFIHPIKVRVPPLHEQNRIAEILGTLDDKIELNRRTNETLEAMAKALFKSWFVDFDPVHEKAAGRQPAGLDAATAKLFPDSFEDSPQGKIPKGWRVGTIADVAENPRRLIQPNEIKSGTAYIGLEHMPRRCIALSEWEETADLESNKFQFNRGEILFGKLRPYFHKVGIAAVDGVCSTDILVLTASTPVWFGLLLGYVSSDEFVAHTDAASGGTKMPRTSWGDMARYSIFIPTVDVGVKFTELLRPLISRIETNIHESRTLATTRDVLLPKLLSGEIHT